MTTTDHPPATVPTSRLHAATLALVAWDHGACVGADSGEPLDPLPEHWKGAQQVWDALQPLYDRPGQLDDLPTRAVLVDHDRDGVTIYVKRDDGQWRTMLRGNTAVVSSAYDARALLTMHGSLRLLWAPR